MKKQQLRLIRRRLPTLSSGILKGVSEVKYDIPSAQLNFHAIFSGSKKWRLSKNGLEIEGMGIVRTKGAPQTVKRVWDSYGKWIRESSEDFNVPVEQILTTLCTESGGYNSNPREEEDYISDEETPHRVSPGLIQKLISTARETLKKHGVEEATIDRKWLLEAKNSIRAGASYIAQQKTKTEPDPVLVAAAYNSGALKRSCPCIPIFNPTPIRTNRKLSTHQVKNLLLNNRNLTKVPDQHRPRRQTCHQ